MGKGHEINVRREEKKMKEKKNKYKSYKSSVSKLIFNVKM